MRYFRTEDNTGFKYIHSKDDKVIYIENETTEAPQFSLQYGDKLIQIFITNDGYKPERDIVGTPDLFTLSYRSDMNDKGQYILATEAEINIYEDDFFNIDELKTVGETDILIKYFEHGELVWQGFALPDFFQTGITNVRVLRIVATDRLGVLKDIANTSTATTPKTIIEECLLQTGLTLPVEIRNNNTYLETTTINRERIEGISAYDVIRTFMVQFNSKIVQYKNKWWVVNKKLLEDGFLGQDIIDIDLVYLDGQREIKPTASEVSLFLEYGGSQRYPNNWDLNKTFYDPTRGLQFIDWTGALYSVNTSKITGYDFIGNIQNAILGDPLTDGKSMFYRSGIHPAFGDLNALTYPHFKSEFSTVKLLTDTDYKLDFRLNFTSASKIFLEAYILIKKDNNYFVYGHKGEIASAGEGTPAIKNIDPFFIRSADREGFGAVQTQWNAELDINKSTLGILEDADGTFEVQIIIMKDRLGGTIYDILETDLFIYSAELALIDNEVESKGLIFKTKQGGDKFSKVRETETTLFSDKINQGVNGYFYNYKYDDTSITNLPKEYLLEMTRQMADMFCSARYFYSFSGNFKVNPLARYRCGNKYFVLVGGQSKRKTASIEIEEIVSNEGLIRTDYIYTYFDDSKEQVKSIGKASG